MTKKDEDAEKRKLAADAARAADFEVTDAWQDLSVLSNKTIINSVEIFEDEIVFAGSKFEGPLLWHVTLSYGQGEDELITSESFPGKFSGMLAGGAATIVTMAADTSSFYE